MKKVARKKRTKRVLTINRLVDMNIVESAIDRKIREQFAVRGIKGTFEPKFWTTGAGDKIDVTLMEEGHLRNAISLCTRRLLGNLARAVWVADTQDYLKNLDMLLDEAKRRGIRV